MSATLYALLASRCGLSQREAADWLGVRIDTVKSWACGRNRAPQGVIDELRRLHAQIERAADESLKVIAAHPDTPVKIGVVADDAEAQALGYPCVGVHRAVCGRVAATTKERIEIVKRGDVDSRFGI